MATRILRWIGNVYCKFQDQNRNMFVVYGYGVSVQLLNLQEKSEICKFVWSIQHAVSHAHTLTPFCSFFPERLACQHD